MPRPPPQRRRRWPSRSKILAGNAAQDSSQRPVDRALDRAFVDDRRGSSRSARIASSARSADWQSSHSATWSIAARRSPPGCEPAARMVSIASSHRISRTPLVRNSGRHGLVALQQPAETNSSTVQPRLDRSVLQTRQRCGSRPTNNPRRRGAPAAVVAPHSSVATHPRFASGRARVPPLRLGSAHRSRTPHSRRSPARSFARSAGADRRTIDTARATASRAAAPAPRPR